MIISHANREYAIVEVTKSNNSMKQLIEGGRKCPEMMGQMFDTLVSKCPRQQRSMKVYGCLLSRLECTPMELSSPDGHVKLMKRGEVVEHPESALLFKTELAALLSYFWRFKLAIEFVLEVMVNG
ncbi:Inorganic pyrophosphatase [Mucor velutinosus]|uniref:Inorganic pyrophosphatase n=1 Tax=Mucor velutinosus TaxID=708070 RepID=A0AAN7HLC6_9FUNG|nr:Inorganic pyrophosphatase [Mucor velutinosus]